MNPPSNDLREIVKRAYDEMRDDRQGRAFQSWEDWDTHAVDELTRGITIALNGGPKR